MVSNYRDKALRALSDLPPFSPVLNRLLVSLTKDDTSFSQLASLIEKDTVLAGNVLRLVNSAMYGRSGTVTSVSHAISILGLVKLRNVALAFSVNRMWKGTKMPADWSLPRFNQHSLAVALLSDQLAQRIPVHYAEGAFVAGLFHDLGELLLVTAFGRNCKSVLLADNPDRPPILTIFEVSAIALEKWNFPKPVQLAVLNCYEEAQAPAELKDGTRYDLARLLYTADETVSALGITTEPVPTDFQPPEQFAALESLNLAGNVPTIVETFRSEYDMMRAAA
jgi:HD-like signal output (HDOD) protein